MEQPVSRYPFSMSSHPDAGVGDDAFLSFTHASEYAGLPLGWDGGGRESMDSFHHTSVSMGWSQPMPTPALNPPDVTMAVGPCMAGHQYAAASTHWLQPTSFGGGDIGPPDTFEPGLCRSDSAPWGPGALYADAHTTVDGSTEAAGYPLAALRAESMDSLLPADWQHHELGAFPEHQPLASEYDYWHHRERSMPSPAGAEGEAETRKRGRPRVQTQNLDFGPPRYMPPAFLRRDSASTDTSYSTSPPTSATAQTFDAADSYHFSGGSDTTATPPVFDDTAAHKPPLSRRASTNPQPSTHTTYTTTPPPPQNQTQKQKQKQKPKEKPTIQARNRAAASRYRAKTQAAFAQLEAEEHDASARNQTLLACAGQLRDEVFQLKNELLRHADCECPLIRGYLERAAERACRGLRG